MKKSKKNTKIPRWALKVAKLYGYEIVRFECDKGPGKYNLDLTLCVIKPINVVFCGNKIEI